jgi:hypothetical protein
MLGEAYDGLIVGSVLTLLTSVVIMFLTNRASEKQWVKQKEREEQRARF